MKDWLDEIKWDNDGLVPAIAQDHKTGRVLMKIGRASCRERVLRLV